MQLRMARVPCLGKGPPMTAAPPIAPRNVLLAYPRNRAAWTDSSRVLANMTNTEHHVVDELGTRVNYAAWHNCNSLVKITIFQGLGMDSVMMRMQH